MSDDPQVIVEPPAYPELQPIGEQRRAYVLDCLTQCGDAPSIDGRVFVNNLDLILRWLETGTVPEEKPKRSLQAVKP